MSTSQSKEYLVPHLVRPRCLYCSKTMYLRNKVGGKKTVIVCPRCGIRYARTFIIDADPNTWERVRLRHLYSIVESEGEPPMLFLNDGVGSRRRER